MNDRIAELEERVAVLETMVGVEPPQVKPAFSWGTRSRERMEGVHRDLVKVFERAIQISPVDMTVLEGRRTVERQRQLVASGASKTMNSRHITGHALDVAPLDEDGKVSWAWPLYNRIAPSIKQAAVEVGVPVEWGGDWTDLKDGPHWQLPWDRYPK